MSDAKTIQQRLHNQPVQTAGMRRLLRDARDHINKVEVEHEDALYGLTHLTAENERLTRERDEARAEVAALCGNPEALDPYLPDDWMRGTPGPNFCGWIRHSGSLTVGESEVWLGNNNSTAHWRCSLTSIKNKVQTVVYPGRGRERSPLAAMRAADAALESAAIDAAIASAPGMFMKGRKL